MKHHHSHHPLDDLAYERTFLPIYAILAGQDSFGGTSDMGAPLIPPVLFWKDPSEQVQAQ